MVREVTIDEAKQAINWAATVIKGGYLSRSSNNPKRKHMKVLLKLSKAQFRAMKTIGD